MPQSSSPVAPSPICRATAYQVSSSMAEVAAAIDKLAAIIAHAEALPRWLEASGHSDARTWALARELKRGAISVSENLSSARSRDGNLTPELGRTVASMRASAALVCRGLPQGGFCELSCAATCIVEDLRSLEAILDALSRTVCGPISGFPDPHAPSAPAVAGPI